MPEERVGSDIWKETVLKSTQGLVYIHEHKDDPGFLTKLVHQLSNQLLSVIIFPNCYPGRCGGWERISREDMVQQAVKEESGNILKCARHETALIYGPLRKRAPENLLKALRMFSELPLGLLSTFGLCTRKSTNTHRYQRSSVCVCHCWS